MTRHVCLIGLDGLRLDDALAGPECPQLQRFVKEGAFAEMTMEVPTISGPGWTSILTGASHAEHRIVDNSFYGNRLLDYPDFLSRAWFADQSVTTWAASSWAPLLDPAGPAPVIWWREEAQRGGRHSVIIRDGETYGYPLMDQEIVDWSVKNIQGGGPRASFIYLGEIDLAGHMYGGVVPEYKAAMASTDARFGALLHSVRDRVAAHPDEEWLVAATTDHGHLDQGGHGGAEDILTKSFFAARWFRADEAETTPVDVPEVIEPTGITPYLLNVLSGQAG